MTPSLLAVAPVAHPGGAEMILLRLLRGLRRRGWRVTLTTPGPGKLADLAAAEGVALERLDLGGLGRGRGLRAVAAWPRARRLAGRHDVTYLNGTVCGRLLPVLRGRRTVLHVHDMVRRVPRMWRGADVVLADSRAVADRLPGLGARVAHPPVELDPAPVAAPWPEGPGPVVGFVGRIEPRKGVLDLVRAAPAIRRGAPGARIVVIGDDDYEVDRDYRAAVTGSGEIEHHPWMDRATGLMGHLDVLVLPSRREPAGTVLAEAMAAGTPVVASRVDGLPEIVADGRTGRLVAPGDPDALAAAVLDVLEHRDEMGRAARDDARRFGLEAFVDAVEPLLLAR